MLIIHASTTRWSNSQSSSSHPLLMYLPLAGSPGGWYDVTSTYVCRHTDCNKAPDPDIYKKEGELSQWRARHEARVDLHLEKCSTKPCKTCMDVFHYNIVKKKVIDLCNSIPLLYGDLLQILGPDFTSICGDALPSLGPGPAANSSSFSSGTSATSSSSSITSSDTVVQDSVVISRALALVVSSGPEKILPAHRRALLRTLCDAIDSIGTAPAPLLIRFFQIPSTTAYRFADPNGQSLVSLAPKVKRPKRDAEVKNFVVTFYYSHSKQVQNWDQNGGRKDVWKFDTPIWDLWFKYMAVCVANHEEASGHAWDESIDLDARFRRLKSDLVVSKTTFYQLRPKNVVPGRIVEFACPSCSEGWNTEDFAKELHDSGCPELVDGLKGNDIHAFLDCPVMKSEYPDLLQQLDDFEEHQRFFFYQRQLLRECISALLPNQALLLFDFSSFEKGFARERTTGDTISDIQCLIVVMYEMVDGEEVRTYFDLFSEAKNDHQLFRRAMKRLFLDPRVSGKEITHFFSDGAPKHFKVRTSICFLTIEMSYMMRWSFVPVWVIFAPNHGKNASDGRAATTKGFLCRVAMRGNRIRGAAQIVSTIRYSEDARLAQRNAFLLDQTVPDDEGVDPSSDLASEDEETADIDTDSPLDASDWSPIVGIRKYFAFRFDRIEPDALKIGETGGKSYKLQCTKLYSLVEPVEWVDHLVTPLSNVKSTLPAPKADQNENAYITTKLDDDDVAIDQDTKVKVGDRVKVLFDEVDDDNKANLWYAGSVLKLGRRPLCKKVGRETFIPTLLVLFDGEEEFPEGEWVDTDENIKLVVGSR